MLGRASQETKSHWGFIRTKKCAVQRGCTYGIRRLFLPSSIIAGEQNTVFFLLIRTDGWCSDATDSPSTRPFWSTRGIPCILESGLFPFFPLVSLKLIHWPTDNEDDKPKLCQWPGSSGLDPRPLLLSHSLYHPEAYSFDVMGDTRYWQFYTGLTSQANIFCLLACLFICLFVFNAHRCFWKAVAF